MKRRVLVIEDQPSNRELLCDWLEDEGYEVFTVSDLSSARSAVQKEILHAVLLDVQLGAEDGLELARWARRQPRLRRLPIIAVSAHAMLTERAAILRAGCNAFVSKPVDFRLLRETLDHWLGAIK